MVGSCRSTLYAHCLLRRGRPSGVESSRACKPCICSFTSCGFGARFGSRGWNKRWFTRERGGDHSVVELYLTWDRKGEILTGRVEWKRGRAFAIVRTEPRAILDRS